ncbi:hypothetical protein PanWU01x14_273210 [Parasponia andersonii]|uniref:Uncharacterized protein n=1 Tax=Parasponia andersonii TaxID=3476 RepID=A0A2P5B424_PARAD|nr:hypothetical protein PanWU01x14_273210 [Parasponia andersonii]
MLRMKAWDWKSYKTVHLSVALDVKEIKDCAALVVTALERLHKNDNLYRGVSPDVLMLDKRDIYRLMLLLFVDKYLI